MTLTLPRSPDFAQTGGVEHLDASSIPHYDAYLSFTGGPALKELEQRFGARRAIPFYCSVDPDLNKRSSLREGFRCDLSYLGTYASDRQQKLRRLLNEPAALLPNYRFLVAGAMYPQDMTWQPNISRFTHVSPPDHPAGLLLVGTLHSESRTRRHGQCRLLSFRAVV